MLYSDFIESIFRYGIADCALELSAINSNVIKTFIRYFIIVFCKYQ